MKKKKNDGMTARENVRQEKSAGKINMAVAIQH